MADIKLPRTVNELSSMFSENSLKKILKTCRDQSKLSMEQALVWKYCGASMLAGRPLNTALIFMVGASGAGKSATINALFDDPNLCKTSSNTSETKAPTLVNKELRVTEESKPVIGQLSFVDVPGTFDTDNKNEAANFASISKFRATRIELAPRQLNSSMEKYVNVRPEVYPNLILFVVRATENRLVGTDSFFRKSLSALKLKGDLVDVQSPNLIVVLSHSMSLPRKRDKFIQILNEKISDIQAIVREVLGIIDVDVVPVENEPEGYFDEDDKEGDFYPLPDGQLSHGNLFDAMLKRFEANKDILGKLLVGWYFNPQCPERESKAVVTQSTETISDSDLAAASTELKKVNINVNEKDLVPVFNFHTLGYGFCPVLEQVKSVNLLNPSGNAETKVITIDSAKFSIPACVNEFIEKRSNFHRLSFFEKEEYQNQMQTSYGIETGFKLVVNASSEGRWVNKSSGGGQSTLIRMIQDVQVASFRIQNPWEHILSKSFKEQLHNLPHSYTDETANIFRSFLSRWGTHMIDGQAVGGAITLNCTVKSASLSHDKFTEIASSISSIFKGFSGSGNNSHATNNTSLKAVGISEERLQLIGGNPPPFPTLESLNSFQLHEWASTVTKRPTELRHTIHLVPYYNFLTDGSQHESLRQATKDYMADCLNKRIKDAYTITRVERSKQVVKEVTKSDDGGPSCFPKGTLVSFGVDGKESLPIEELSSHQGLKLATIRFKGLTSLGGKIKLGERNGMYATSFCVYLDKKDKEEIEYLALHFSNGKKLLVSEAHMIFQFIPGQDQSQCFVKGKQAKHFKVGEMAVYSGKNGTRSTPKIERISKEKHFGAYSPLTTSGTFLADGFLVSSYANTDSFAVAQGALLPLKIWSKLHKKNKPSSLDLQNGIHPFARFLISFRKSLTSVNK